MNASAPQGAAARKAWRQLDEDTRRQVYALARQGEAHPDPTISGIAYGWASQVGPRLLWRLPLALITTALLIVLTNQVAHGSIGWSPGGALVAVMVITLQVGPHWWLARRVETANAASVRPERR